MPQLLTTPVSELWPELGEQEAIKARRLVARAEAIVLQRFPTIPHRIEQETLSKTVVAGVIEDMVSRALEKQRRDGLEKVQYPEVTLEWEADGALGTGSKLWLTTDELLLLSPPKATGSFSITKKPAPTLPESRW